MPDNVFEQIPWICGILGFFGTFGIFQRPSEQMQEEACLPDNVLEQTPRICGILGLEIQSQETRFLKTRGRAEKEPRISIPVPAVPVSELLAGKKWKICKSLN